MLGMNCTPASRPQATGESLVGENATALCPLIGPISVSVSALFFAPTIVSPNQAYRRAVRSGAGRAVYRPHVRAPCERRTHMGPACRPVQRLFPGRGLPRAGGPSELTFSVMEEG